VTKRERTGRKRGTSTAEHWCLPFADDCALFLIRENRSLNSFQLYKHLLKFGRAMNIGTGATLAKNEAIHFSLGPLCSDADTSRPGASVLLMYIYHEYMGQEILRRNSNTLTP
jgi:hypothetical protein